MIWEEFMVNVLEVKLTIKINISLKSWLILNPKPFPYEQKKHSKNSSLDFQGEKSAKGSERSKNTFPDGGKKNH